MYGNNYRNSSLTAEEIKMLKAISRVSARPAQKLAALGNQRQTKEGGNRKAKAGGYGHLADPSVSSPAPAKPEPNPAPTLEQVRAVLAEKSRAGHTAAIRELLQKYGASKLSLVDPQQHETLLKDVEGLADAT